MASALMVRPSEIILGRDAPTWWAYQIDVAVFSKPEEIDESELAPIASLKQFVR